MASNCALSVAARRLDWRQGRNSKDGSSAAVINRLRQGSFVEVSNADVWLTCLGESQIMENEFRPSGYKSGRGGVHWL